MRSGLSKKEGLAYLHHWHVQLRPLQQLLKESWSRETWPRGRDESWQLRDNAEKEMTSVEEKEKCDQRTLNLGKTLNSANYVGDRPKMCDGFNCVIVNSWREDFKARCKLSLTTPSFSCHRKGHSCLYLTEFQGKRVCGKQSHCSLTTPWVIGKKSRIAGCHRGRSNHGLYFLD